MALIRSFRAVRPRPDLAAKVASVPYDVVDTQEARELVKDNPYSLLRITRSDLEFADSQNPYADEIYAKAKLNWGHALEEGWLVREGDPTSYIYELEMNGRTQTGIATTSSVDDYNRGIIKKHEKTREEKERDRIRHIRELRAQTGPVFLAYREDPTISQLVTDEKRSNPLYNFTAPDGIRHTIWKCANPQRIVDAFAKIPHTYIADGHHRAASAAKCRELMMKANGNHTGAEDYNFFLTVIFPDTQLKILPYHRTIKSLNGRTSAEILAALGEQYSIEKVSEGESKQKGDFRFYIDGQWYRLSLPAGTRVATDANGSLETTQLQTRTLAPIFGIADPRTDKNIDFVGGIRGTEYLKQLVDSGKAACAFALYPTSMDELFRIADAGEIMAPKSTWFEPKLRDGLLVHTF